MRTATDVSVATEVLVPFFRVTRRPLVAWTESLLERFAHAQANAGVSHDTEWPATCDRIASCFNEAALIESHLGRPQHALTLCHSQIAWARRVSRQAGRLAAAQFAFQAHINMGRLDRNHRQWDASIAKFRCLKDFRPDGCVAIGAWLVTREHVAAIMEANPEFGDQMTANYVVDTLMTLLRARRYSDVCAFADAPDGSPVVRLEWVRELAYEAGVIAWSQLDDREATDRVDTYLRRPRRTNGAVFLYRRAELLCARGDLAGAARIANGLAVACLASGASAEPDTLNLRLIARIARLLTTLGEARAVPLTRLGLTRAEQSNDVLFQQEFLTLLASNAGTAQERHEASDRADAVHRHSLYGSAIPFASLDALYERLVACGGEDAR
jgi:hypothetical protein